MVLSKDELIRLLQHEVDVLVHLAGKVDARSLDYKPTPKQRSTIEWLRYMAVMGPGLIAAAKTGAFDREAWGAANAALASMSIEQVIAKIAEQKALFAQEIGAMSDADFRGEIEMFGQKQSRGYFIVHMIYGGYAAYRTQIFNHLKITGREELGTANLWRGVDPAPAA
jgi:hypothetical protein